MSIRTAHRPQQSTPARTGAPRPAGRLWSAVSVVLATVGCAPPGPKADESAIAPLRHWQQLGAAGEAGTMLSWLRGGVPGGPLLVLVHGTPGAASGWADYVIDAPPGMEVIAIDRPGFGDSGPASAVTSLREQADAVLALLPADGRPVVLLGHSLGGPIAAQLAADHPDRVDALVLLAASLDPTLEAIHPMQRVGDWSMVRALLPRAIRNANAELMALEPELAGLVPRLPDIRARVVIMHGTADDLVPVANVAFMQARLTGARCVKTVLLEGRNHFLPWNSPEQVREAVRLALEPAC
jgi:pimeloyl-ACP methyl ester carboxylesterase